VSLGVVEQVARDYCQQRKKKATATAIDGIYKQAQKAGISLNKALEICCARGWEGFKAEWIKDKPQQGQQLTAYQQSIKSAGISIFGNLEEKYAERTIDATPITRQLGTKDF
jgi:CTP synthase (UTP-ammonia lyase)